MNEELRLLADAAFANKLNVVHHAYVDIAGGLIEGALLGQILYWFGNGKDGQIRARIERDGHLWIAKTRSDWWDEIRISPKQYDRAAKVLKDKGFIEIKTMKFNGNPTTHLRIVAKAINDALDEWKKDQVKSLLPKGEEPRPAGYSPSGNNAIPETEPPLLPKGEEPNQPFGEMELPESGITTYTENTTTEYSKDHRNHAETVAFINENFEIAWNEYPRKEGKLKAKQAFERAVRSGSVTAEEIILQVRLYASYMEQRVLAGECETKHIARGDNWFAGERWQDEFPSIAKTFDDFADSMEYNRNLAMARQTVAKIGQARSKGDEGALHRLAMSFRKLLTVL